MSDARRGRTQTTANPYAPWADPWIKYPAMTRITKPKKTWTPRTTTTQTGVCWMYCSFAPCGTAAGVAYCCCGTAASAIVDEINLVVGEKSG
jgi:hypothetical protein